MLFTALYLCFVYFMLEVDLFVPLSVYLCCQKQGQSWVKLIFFSNVYWTVHHCNS